MIDQPTSGPVNRAFAMEKRCVILEEDPQLRGVVKVRVPGVYGRKGDPLPMRMSRLVVPAAQALDRVFQAVAAEGGHLYISDMFRSAREQQKAHEDWKCGRKSSFSPPSCSSVHEAARAIDIDAFDTGIGHFRVREILNLEGWTHIVETLTGSECWHYEYREERWEEFRKANHYKAMARAMKEEIGNLAQLKKAQAAEEEVRWLQQALNQVLGTLLVVDGVFGEETRMAVRLFQQRFGLQVDGAAGPITFARLRELIP